MKLVYDPQTDRLLGAQAVGCDGVDKRLDVIATAMAFRGNVRDLAGLDLCYAPPFGSAKDPVHLAAFAACNQIDGVKDFLAADADLRANRSLDVRTTPEVARLPYPAANAVTDPAR